MVHYRYYFHPVKTFKINYYGVFNNIIFAFLLMANTLTVRFNFSDPSREPVVVEARKGDTILDAALDNNISLHHNCGAVCACSTCHVYINQGMETLGEISDKEEDFIDRAVMPKINSRLACQCIVVADLMVTIPDQSVHLGH